MEEVSCPELCISTKQYSEYSYPLKTKLHRFVFYSFKIHIDVDAGMAVVKTRIDGEFRYIIFKGEEVINLEIFLEKGKSGV